jgi:3-hydroxybutyrate dehydrogenase
LFKESEMLKGKTALVTGSSGGIGLAIAQELAAAGSNVVLHGLEDSSAVVEQLAALRLFGVSATYHQKDLQNPKEVEQLVALTLEQFGCIDILVNNAVTRHFSPIEAFPTERWDQALSVNLSAPFHFVKVCLPLMRQAGWGRIINMTSVYGSRGTPNRIDYVTTKSALIGMTRAIAAEVVGQNITCNALCPGSVLTPNIESRIRALMQEKKLDWEVATAEFLQGKQPGGKLIPAKHLAELALFLCTSAGGQMNGAVLPMENGWLAL